MFYDLFIPQLWKAREIQQARVGLGRQIFQVSRLLLRQPHRAHLIVGELENSFRCQRLASQRSEWIEDCHSSLAVQLLVQDGFGQTVKLGRPKLHPTWPDALDNGAHYGVGFLKVCDGLSHAYTFTTRRRSQANKKRIVRLEAQDRRQQLL